MTNPRTLAARTLLQVVDNGRSLSDLLPKTRVDVAEADRGFYQQLVYGSVRHYLTLDEIARRLLNKPIQRKERVVHMVLVVGLYQLWLMEVPVHAALNETVDATKPLKKPWAKGVINASMRRFLREREEILAKLQNQAGYPGWLTRQLRQDYPDQWQQVLENGNVQGPMTLRVNQRRLPRQQWLDAASEAGLSAQACPGTASAVTLRSAVPVTLLPGFEDGDVSVQDEAAQQCAFILDPQPGEHILDACSAPGGKTGHLLERADCEVTALDIDETRLERVQENLSRLSLSARLVTADASDLALWWNSEKFDRILLDAPCSGTGVIRRHPDIKLLRRRKDIEFLAEVQAAMLHSLWQTLKPGGRLLYATCSIFRQENEARVLAFLRQHGDARTVPMDVTGDAETEVGVQWLPQPDGHDGFYYALLEKRADNSG